MASTPTYPGVYIQEIPSTVHTISGVATSIAAFVGYTAHGIDNRAEHIFSFSDFERLFGGLSADSELSYAVQQFFQNGGTEAYVIRTPRAGATAANVVFGGLTFTALSSGAGANGQLLVDVDYTGIDHAANPKLFNLKITSLVDGTVESFPNVTVDNTLSNYVVSVVNDPDNGSQLVKVQVAGVPGTAPTVSGVVGANITTSGVNTALGGGATKTTANNDYGVKLSTSAPPPPPSPLPLDIKLISSGGPIPQTMSGLAAQVQTAINAALAVQWPGAYVVASVSGSGANQAIRVNAFLPNAPDAVLTFAAPSGSLHDGATPLGLAAPAHANVAHYALGTGNAKADQTGSTAGGDGTGLPGTSEIIGDQGQFTGIYALLKVDLFNLLSIPDATRAAAGDPSSLDSAVNPNSIYSAAVSLCKTKRAFLLIDVPPPVNTVSSAVDWKTSGLAVHDPNGAAFFPRLRLPDPLNKYQLRTFAPSGVVAGLYARIDSTREVWKAPAGTEATLTGVQGLVYKLSDLENGALNPLGLNCFRTFPVYGSVLWGARTLVGADADASQWKYVPVRRVALFLEESLYRGTQWVVFEPNDEPLWAQIRLNVGAFMNSLFRKGAFQGKTPTEAYFVKCDKETTTQNDIDQGIVNILVGFAPLKPAEFVIIQIQQMAGQIQS